MHRLADFSLKVVYLPGLKNSAADALRRPPFEMGWPSNSGIGTLVVGYMHCKMQLFLPILWTG